MTKPRLGCLEMADTYSITADYGGSTVIKIPEAATLMYEPSAGEIANQTFNRLFRQYTKTLRCAGLDCFIISSILFDLWALLVPLKTCPLHIVALTTFLVMNVSLLICLHIFSGSSPIRELNFKVIPYFAWLLGSAQLYLHVILQQSPTHREALGWAILLPFLMHVALPMPKPLITILGIITITIYSAITLYFPHRLDNNWMQQLFANFMLMVCAELVGLMYHWLTERKHLRSFLEAKKSLEVKMVIEEQSAEQERLLLSVLPEHVAVKMRQDLGSSNSEQFKKIYMSRHENVSILYADIVGFTAISSTYSAQDLVKMLNELFARFDRLAEKYHQLRIKILGDCYYCISGAPIERPDHAALCVHMGLSMVKAIKYVQQKTNSPVDMRVGIHTGAILAGILGQRQWQFDVYSKDVELANKMESSGLAGKVHISEKTLSYLNGEFEVEPAFGEKREETLRIAGLKTYFIKSVIIPFTPDKEPPNGASNGMSKTETVESIKSDAPSTASKEDDDDTKANSIEEDLAETSDANEEFMNRLKFELLSRDRHSELNKETNILLSFNNKDLDAAFSKHCEPLFTALQLAFTFVSGNLLIIFSGFSPPCTWPHMAYISSQFLLNAFVYRSVSEYFPKFCSGERKRNSKVLNLTKSLRNFSLLLVVALSIFYNLPRMLFCSPSSPVNIDRLNITVPESYRYCIQYPSYYSNAAVLLLIASTVQTQVSHLYKAFYMAIIIGFHCWANTYFKEPNMLLEEVHPWNSYLPVGFNLSTTLIATSIALLCFARHMDKEDRVIFKWKTEVSEQKEKVSDMRRRNEALVYNILPQHVAEHFMRNKARSYDELYSQSYDEVGVLFASMPNFSDFYSEDTVNNQGLECLRFLNEVISDFDALLEVPRFHDVIKIKTIGSTYMAASGLNPMRQIKPEDAITLRWEHLAVLVDFALELKKALQSINEQSFNHFVLKMGINHGPITAGVIGARKPHYDIWGNTVNVASRMESTGKAGAVQVTEETCHILQTFGYTFEQRGLVAVKGKGELMTYYLQGKNIRIVTSAHNSPMLSSINPMETLPEDDESRESQFAAHPQVSAKPNLSNRHLSRSPSTDDSTKVNAASSTYLDGESPTTDVASESTNDETLPDVYDPPASTPLLAAEMQNSSNASGTYCNSSKHSEKDALISSVEGKQL